MPSSHSIARGLREVLVGEDPLQVDRLWQRMFHASDHYGRRGAALHAISAIDLALWDIAGKAAGRPVSDLLGGRRLERVPVYASEVMPDTPAEVRQSPAGPSRPATRPSSSAGARSAATSHSTRSSCAPPGRSSAPTGH